ncbi:MAG: thioredoxin fold domain-containing protein [Alphaproteobacteria bacterium]|nr:thioredoxin fold domain-containing protein [Alphaproteobacteria bacterium]
MRKFAVAVLVCALGWAGPASAEYRVESIDNDYRSAVEDAKAENKRLVLFFHQAGCPYCDKMRARVHPAPMVMDYFSQHYVMMEVNIKGNLDMVAPDGSASSEADYSRKIRVRATPVFVFYDQDGSEALRTTGYLDEKGFLTAGRYVVDGVHKTDTSFFRYLQGKK